MGDNGRGIEDEAREMMRANCGHVCHERRLNPWIKSCPTCGCENPKYDPEAVSDIAPSEFNRWLGVWGL